MVHSQQRCRVVTTVSIKLCFDLSHFVFAVTLNSIVQNKFHHPHCHYEALRQRVFGVMVHSQQRCRVVTTVSIKLCFDLSHFVFAVTLNSIVQNKFHHPHCHYEAMYVLEWHVDVVIVVRQFSIRPTDESDTVPGGNVDAS